MTASDAPPWPGRDLRARYTAADLEVLSEEEARRFIPDGTADPERAVTLAWELLYRREPDLYDRLARAERIHPEVLGWLPDRADRIVEVGAGTGRLTLDLLGRARELVAVEPAAPLREILERKLAEAAYGHRALVTDGFFDDLPPADDWADLVISCSAFTPEEGHGGDAGLAEMERICRLGGRVVLVWPYDIGWLTARGYRYESFDGEMAMEFVSPAEAAELTEIFYPHAATAVRRRGERRVPYSVLGVNPPRDLAFKVMAA